MTSGQVHLLLVIASNNTVNQATQNVANPDDTAFNVSNNLAFISNTGRTFDQRAELNQVANLGLVNTLVINDTVPEVSLVSDAMNEVTINSDRIVRSERGIWNLNFETQVQMEVERRFQVERANKDKTSKTLNDSLTDTSRIPDKAFVLIQFCSTIMRRVAN